MVDRPLGPPAMVPQRRAQGAGTAPRALWGPRPPARRTGPLPPALAAAGLILAVVATIACPPRPLLLWNASPSSPIGLYWLAAPDGAKVGGMVAAWAPEDARHLAARRSYLPAGVPLVKRVAAAAGDRVCARGAAITINGRASARRHRRDPSGRLMPRWTGCLRIPPGDLFLLSPGADDAFDGRYFGVTRREDLIAEARLLWRG